MKKQVSTVHLYYLIIVSTLLISFIAILAFGKNPEAGDQMNVAATVTSIILAVIAIIMTLVDVAGQRQSIIELKETAERLKESNTVARATVFDSLSLSAVSFNSIIDCLWPATSTRVIMIAITAKIIDVTVAATFI